jgi:methionyl-tRNA synthetase
MSQRFTAGILHHGGPFAVEDQALQASLAECTAAYQAAMDDCEVSRGLEAISRHVVHCNGYAERMKPWELNKDPAQHERLATVLYHLAESVAHAAVLLGPILPAAAAKLADQLNLPALTTLKLSDLHWGMLADGHEIGKPKPVFPRIVVEEPGA